MHDAINVTVIVAYLVVIAVIGLRLSGRQRTAADYFTGERSMPWWSVMGSIVATETSTLTVISVPGVAYLTNFSYVELAFGYIIGRTLVSFVLLPLYFRGGFVSAYQYLGERFGRHVQGLASLTFLITRLLAEGVRLFASAIPIKLLLKELGVSVNYFVIILVLSLITVAYTYVGGIKAVIWTDVIQMTLYLGGAVVCIAVLLGHTGVSALGDALDAGKFHIFQTDDWSFFNLVTNPYAFLTAVVGGAIFGMASHGSDQLIAQRVLATKSLSDGRKAMIGSGIAVTVQFALFSLVGALLWVYKDGAALDKLGFKTSDQIFPDFVLHGLPVGLSGLLIAGILAATMGSLSSALNSLSNSTVADIMSAWLGRRPTPEQMLTIARYATLAWTAVMVVFASLFDDTGSQVVVIGLSITGYTYGAMLGAFILGLLVKRAGEVAAAIALVTTVVVMAWVVLRVKVTPAGDMLWWEADKAKGTGLAFPWFVPLGVLITLVVGGLVALVRPARPKAPPAVDDREPVVAR
ncbi:transporter, SSS family [Jatrophihabitans endophyticus]|uniref:Transporter, SSS family n=1 Tax=Jatrophihabitans endophyticus TaxID=1206085 RepID=A0A1M5SQ91_9ACTN|nr:sodium:solute symporter [Jatrophihabitans endophyticus]SHH40699.1 transporter, SSS family [Jatrophihabitans endophyticus]